MWCLALEATCISMINQKQYSSSHTPQGARPPAPWRPTSPWRHCSSWRWSRRRSGWSEGLCSGRSRTPWIRNENAEYFPLLSAGCRQIRNPRSVSTAGGSCSQGCLEWSPGLSSSKGFPLCSRFCSMSLLPHSHFGSLSLVC